MGLLSHEEMQACPHPDCDKVVRIVKSNVSGKVKRLEHVGGNDL